MLTHDIAKMRYTDDGYLMNYPYHMISDTELFSAFMDNSGAGFFSDSYPMLSETEHYVNAYHLLVLAIQYYIIAYEYDSTNTIPDWVYTYILGSSISIYSDSLDIHDLSLDLHTQNDGDEFTEACSAACLQESEDWLGNTINSTVIAATNMPAAFKTYLESRLQQISIDGTTLYDIYHADIEENGTLVHTADTIIARPATMFGEPHVLKSLRMKQITM